MFDQRCPLISGTQIQISEECIYQIIGEPIGFGGGSIIYPAQKLVPHNGSWVSDGFEYVLKECYPASTDHWYMRNHSGEIVSKNSSQGEDAYLSHIKQMMLDESSVSRMIFKTASRIIPIRDSATDIILYQPGKQCEHVHNTITIMDSLRLKGRALTYHIKERGCLSPLQTFHIIQQLLLALEEVHQAGFLHLDLQDGNVFIKGTLDDENNLVTLIDFGSARHMCDGKTEMIEDRMVFSTQGYSAPEILFHNDGTLRLGPEADIYSVGCMILHMLTGSRADLNSLVNNTSGKYLSRFKLRKISCPAHLVDRMQAIIARALEKKPEDRYHSAEAMLADVCDFVKALQPYRSDLSSMDYDAFICYKHGPTDSAAARVLQQKLEHFRVPKKKGENRHPFQRVFLDEGELSSCADFGETIRAALKNAGWLIVVCSPDTPLSPWVRSEIDVFLEYHDRSRILAVLTEGEPEESFPAQLLGADKTAGEVLAADARGKDVNEVLRRIKRDAVLRIAAPMLGVPYDSLRQRRKVYVMKRLAALAALALALVSAFSVYAVVQNIRVEEQYDAVRIRESRYLSEVAEKALEEGDRTKAINIALLALPSEAQDRPYVPDAERVLADALHSYAYNPYTGANMDHWQIGAPMSDDLSEALDGFDTVGEFLDLYSANFWFDMSYDMKLSMNGEITDMIACEDAYLCAVTEDKWIGVFNVADGTCLWQRKLQEIVDDSTIGDNDAYAEIKIITCDTETGKLIITYVGHIICVDLQSGACVWVKNLNFDKDIACCLQGNQLYAFSYSAFLPDNTIHCFSLADGTDMGYHSMDTSVIADGNSVGACFDDAQIFVDAERRVVIAASLPTGNAVRSVVCMYNLRTGESCMLERSDEFLALLPVGGDYYLASAAGSTEEPETYDRICITRISCSGIGLDVIWERAFELSSPLDAWSIRYQDAIEIWEEERSISIGIEREILNVALSDGSLISRNDADSDIVAVRKASRPIILKENGDVWLSYSTGNFWRIATLGRETSGLAVGSDFCAVTLQDQPQAVYVLRFLSDERCSAIFRDQDFHDLADKVLLSSDGNRVLLIYSYSADGEQGAFGRLVDLRTMEKLGGWYFDGAEAKDFLQLSADGGDVLWRCDSRLFRTNLFTSETVTLADGIDSRAAIAVAPLEIGQPARMAVLNCASKWGENQCYENEFRLQYYVDGTLLSDERFAMQTAKYYVQGMDCFFVGNNGHCIFNARTDAGDTAIVFNAEEGTFAACEDLSAMDGQNSACLASEHPWYACQDSTGSLRIQDYSSGEAILTLDGFASTCTWSGFSADDAFLFVLSNKELIAIDVEARGICNYLELESDPGSAALCLLEGDGFYLLHAPAKNEGYIISRPEMHIRTHLSSTLGFIPGQNSVLIRDGYGDVALYPVHELDELIEMGIRTIGKHPLSEKECIESNIDYANYSEVYAKWMQSIETEQTHLISGEERIIDISADDSTAVAVSVPEEESATAESEQEAVEPELFLVEQEDGSVLATWIDETPSRAPYALTSYYGIYDWYSDDPQFHFSIARDLTGSEYRIENLLPDTQYTIFLHMANGDMLGEYFQTSATPDYSEGDVSFQRAMLQGGEGQDAQCADSWLLADVQRQLASGDLKLVCSFDTTAACPAGERKLLIRVIAPNGSVGEKGLSIDLQSDACDQQIVMDFNIDVLLNMIEEKLSHIPTGEYMVDLYIDRQYLGNASFSINLPDA